MMKKNREVCQPRLVNVAADLAPQNPTYSDSFFITSNLMSTTGDHEFGLLTHYVKFPGTIAGNSGPTVAITDVTDNLYIMEEDRGGSIRPGDDGTGFVVDSEILQWTAGYHTMEIHARTKNGEGSYDLMITREGPDLIYSGSGYFPLFDDSANTYQYAFPRMKTTGTVTVKGKEYTVEGESWLDRQWFMSLAGPRPERDTVPGPVPGVTYWTWLSIRLSNGVVVAIWDTINDYERCWANVLYPDGTLTIADVDSLDQTSTDRWKSSLSGVIWPGGWNIKIPGVQAELRLTLSAEGQETTYSGPRIEGVIHVKGTFAGDAVTGNGYAEICEDHKLSLD